MNFSVSNLNFSYKKKNLVLKQINISSFEKGKLTVVIGPNGSGKSTLLKCLAGILRSYIGTIFLNKINILEIPSKILVKEICYMPQNTYCNASITVFEAILLAKKLGHSNNVTKENIDQVSHLLYSLQIESISKKFVSEISGGQRQIVSLAQSICRKPKILLLDEPTSALDIQHQIEIIQILKQLIKEYNLTYIAALHDLNLAAHYADNIILMDQGKIIEQGLPKIILTEKMLADIYHIKAKIENREGKIQIYPIKSLHKRETNYLLNYI